MTLEQIFEVLMEQNEKLSEISNRLTALETKHESRNDTWKLLGWLAVFFVSIITVLAAGK